MPGPSVAVKVEDVAKEFRLPHERVHTLKERALHPFRRTGVDVLRALEGVSFDVAEGEFFGIVGRNGSGKSTLLKCLAGIYRVDDGEIRLAFSVMSHVDADVLLIDEVLAVGDAAFQQKCFDVFNRLKHEGKTILFVTHDMAAVGRFCDRAILLERGRVEVIGPPDTVGARYMQRNFETEATAGRELSEGERVGDRSAEIVEAWFEQDGQRTTVLRQGEDCTFRMRLRFNSALDDPICAFLLEDERQNPLFAVSNEDVGTVTGSHAPGEDPVFGVTFRNVFAPGRVYATPWLLHDGGAAIVDRRPRLANAVVTALHRSGGLVDLPASATYERPGERAQA